MKTNSTQSCQANGRPASGNQRGVALITSMLILTMLTLLALSMFRGFGLQQKISGNVSEKERAYEAAQSALEYAEWWLAFNNSDPVFGIPSPVACSGPVTVSSPTNMRVCNAPLTNPNDPTTWTGVSTVQPAAMTVGSGGSYVDANGNTNINYSQAPGLYINWLNETTDPTNGLITNYYAITAVGYGGSANTTAVVQSIYKVALTSLRNL